MTEETETPEVGVAQNVNDEMSFADAYAAARAMDAGIYALYTDGRHRVSFDQVVKVMLETGNDLPSVYKETSEGGLAKHLD